MADYKSDNADVKETLAQVQGIMDLFQRNMETILEILQAHRDSIYANPTAANVTNVVGVTNVTAHVAATVETLMESVSPTIVNHHLVPSTVNRIVVAYT